MKYLPILDELITSDLIYILLVGVGVSIILLFVGCFALGFAMCSLAIYMIVSIKKNK